MMDGCWLMSPSSLFERRRALGFFYFASLIKKNEVVEPGGIEPPTS